MVLPVVIYNDSILRKKCIEIDETYPDLDILINDMWETVDKCNAFGIAAPQINLSIKLFLVNTNFDNPKNGIRQVFINPTILSKGSEVDRYNEGCLSLPGILESVERPTSIVIQYFDENFDEHIEVFSGINARVIQHEYDHIQGKLFIDYLSPLGKRLLKGRLDKILRKDFKTTYKVK